MRALTRHSLALICTFATIGCGPVVSPPPPVVGGGTSGGGDAVDPIANGEDEEEAEADGRTSGGDAEPDSPFEIDLVFVTGVNDANFDAFDRARARWETIIVDELAPISGSLAEFARVCGYTTPDEEVDSRGVTIFVELAPIDGLGSDGRNVLGQAGPCLLRDDGSPAVGGMTFDTADLDFLAAQGLLEAVVLHEMGHVLGIGTLWASQGLLENPSVPNNAGADTFFTGASAQTAFLDLLGGEPPPGGNIVPVENSGLRGSGDGHWRENVLRNELMSPALDPPARGNPLSVLTIASLQDLGFYETNLDAADPYLVPLQLESSVPSPLTPLQHDCILMEPVGNVAPTGAIRSLASVQSPDPTHVGSVSRGR